MSLAGYADNHGATNLADIINIQQGGNEIVFSGGGDNTVAYLAVAESTGVNFDIVVGFDFSSADRFELPSAVGGVDTKVTTGALSSGSFDSDLTARITSAKLAVGHAVLFTPNGGNLAGHTFLIVDANGTAGYQTSGGGDYVIELASAVHLSAINGADFI